MRFLAQLTKLRTPHIQRALQPIQWRYYGAAAGLDKAGIQSRVLELLSEFDKVDQSKLGPEAHFTKDLKLDSLDTVEVIMAVEEEFSIEIPDHDSDEIKTVKDVVEYISLRNDAI